MDVLVDRKHRVLHITLNRPEKRNALSAAMCRSIVDAVDGAQHDAHVGSIMLCATGHVFCAGMDLDEAVTLENTSLDELHAKLFSLGRRALKPIVMCVNGAALGGGLGLVAQGHIVVASSAAVFGLPEIRVGLWPLLVYRSIEVAIGPRRTLELSLTGRVFHCDEALAWGLVSHSVHPEEASSRAKGIANDLAKASPEAIHAGFRLRADSDGVGSDQALNTAVNIRRKLMASDDFREGVAAFKEKREPRWPSMPH